MGHTERIQEPARRDFYRHSQGQLMHQSNSDDGSVNEIGIREFILIQIMAKERKKDYHCSAVISIRIKKYCRKANAGKLRQLTKQKIWLCEYRAHDQIFSAKFQVIVLENKHYENSILSL